MSTFIRIIGVVIGLGGIIGFIALMFEAQPSGVLEEPDPTLIGMAFLTGFLGVAIGSMWYYVGKVGARVETVAEAYLSDQDAEVDEEGSTAVRRKCQRHEGVHIPAHHDECPRCGEPVTDGRHPPV